MAVVWVLLFTMVLIVEDSDTFKASFEMVSMSLSQDFPDKYESAKKWT